MNAPARLIAHSEEVLIAAKWQFSITVCTDPEGRPWEVVLKCRDRAGREGSDTATMAADLGIAISRMMNGRPAKEYVTPIDALPGEGAK
jgi:hypothetical protein